MRTIVVYMSQTGFTKRYAEWIAERMNADLLNLKEAKKNRKGPTLIEFIIEDEDLVMPMIKPNGAITDLITEMDELEVRK